MLKFIWGFQILSYQYMRTELFPKFHNWCKIYTCNISSNLCIKNFSLKPSYMENHIFAALYQRFIIRSQKLKIILCIFYIRWNKNTKNIKTAIEKHAIAEFCGPKNIKRKYLISVLWKRINNKNIRKWENINMCSIDKTMLSCINVFYFTSLQACIILSKYY